MFSVINSEIQKVYMDQLGFFAIFGMICLCEWNIMDRVDIFYVYYLRFNMFYTMFEIAASYIVKAYWRPFFLSDILDFLCVVWVSCFITKQCYSNWNNIPMTYVTATEYLKFWK